MLSFLSYSDMTREESDIGAPKNVLRLESPGIEIIAQDGVFCGSTSAFYKMLATQSAITASANGQQDADAAEFAAEILLQAMFDLQPLVNILEVVRREVYLRKEHVIHELGLQETVYEIDLTLQQGYIGDFHGANTTLSVLPGNTIDQLCVRFNGNVGSDTDLHYCRYDRWSPFPTSFELYLKNCMLDWNNRNLTFLHFERNGSGTIAGFYWQWDHEGGSSWFARK